MSYQSDKIPLGDLVYSAGANFSINLKGKIQNQLRNKFPHLARLLFECDITPTLSSGSVTPAQAQHLVESLRIRDNREVRHDGGFASLRLLEAMENAGRLRTADPDSLATTEQGSFVRVWEPWPGILEAGEQDGLDPVPLWEQGTIEGTFGTLAQISGTATACAGNVRVYAEIVYLDDLRLGVRSESLVQDLVGNAWERTDGGLYCTLGLANSSAIDAITNGDFNTVQITDQNGIGQTLPTEVLQRAFEAQCRAGSLNAIAGDLRASTDDNNKVASGTALAAAGQLLQPVIWCPPRGRMTKLIHEARPNLKIVVAGSQSTGHVVFRRAKPMDGQLRDAKAAEVARAFGVSIGEMKYALISKKANVQLGSRALFLPGKMKTA